MKTVIEPTGPETIRGDRLCAGDYGVVVGGKDNGHYVYRHNSAGAILDLSCPLTVWSDCRVIQVRLLALNESIVITRTE